jgi:DNA-binding protein WhiA
VSLSEDVRAELASIDPRKPCCRIAELSALMRGAGTIHLRGAGRIGLHLELGSHAVARRAVALLHEYDVQCEIRTYRRRSFEHETRFEIHLDDDARSLQVLNEAGILGAGLAPLERPPSRLVGRACCRAAYLRGAFLAAGSVSGPGDAHLELRASDVEGAQTLTGLAAKDGFALGVAERRQHAFAYAKGNETIAELLAYLGAQEAALLFGERAVVSATKARANRLANADHANLRRSSSAAEAQLRAIERLREQGRLELAEPQLREIADLRSRHPTLSLRELAGRCRPPATKAAVHRRLTKLRRLADGA